MTVKTKRLTYNVNDRGRKYRGVDRIFDTVALARLINSPEVQERVQKGDMIGYYGHWPRIKFGMPTQEAGIIDGKVINTPTAVRTIYLSADDQGNITHQAEFLDTVDGETAAKLYLSNVGGFSSAIDALPRSSPYQPTAFHGFDFVLEPNYDTNRGYGAILDSVEAGGLSFTPEMMAMLDAVMEEQTSTNKALLSIMDSMQAQHNLALEALDAVSKENDLLIGRLASQANGVVLDDVGSGMFNVGFGGRTLDEMHRFRDEPLVALQQLEDETKKPEDKSSEAKVLRNHLGFKV